MLRGSSAALPLDRLAGTLRDLALYIVAPLAIGQALRARLRDTLSQHTRLFSTVNSILILFIVWLTVSETASNGRFVESLLSMAGPFLYLAVLHVLLVAASFLVARLSGLGHPETVTMLFVAPQKTLAMGAPLLSIYFASQPELLGVALLPLLFYHPWQLVVAGVISGLPWMSDPRHADRPVGTDHRASSRENDDEDSN